VSAAHQRRHGHQHFHQHNKEVRDIQERAEAAKEKEKRAITATINGQVVSWPANSAAASSTPPPVLGSNGTQPHFNIAPAPHNQTGGSTAPPSGGSFGAGSWNQAGHYDAEAQILTNLVFLNNKGDPGVSGTWDL
jgi:hypothetical protein